MTKKKRRTFSHIHRQRLDRAVALYLQHCYKRNTVARVSGFAAFLGRNAEYLTRITLAIAGVSLGDFIRRKQLEEAERLLVTTPLPVQQIALYAGFGSSSAFYRCFTEAHGMPPGRFREVRKWETK